MFEKVVIRRGAHPPRCVYGYVFLEPVDLFQPHGKDPARPPPPTELNQKNLAGPCFVFVIRSRVVLLFRFETHTETKEFGF